MRRQRGFTLIELLVVIAIIALLMAILMPALSRVKKQAQSVACQAKLKQWGLAFKLYTDDHDGYFNEGWGKDDTTLFPHALRSYYKSDDNMLLCPTATREMLNDNDWGTFKAAYRTMGGYRYVFSYGINSWTNYMHADRGDRLEEWFWKNVNNAKNTSKIPILGDSTWHDAWPRDTDSPSLTMDAFGIMDQGTSGEINHFCIDRHNGFNNMIFMDWSVRSVGLKELWTLKWHRDFNTSGAWTMAGGVQPSDWPRWLQRYRDY